MAAGLPRIVAFTPAGRQQYMQLLAPHILGDSSVAEWYVLDNCRNDADREWLEREIAPLPKVRVFRKPDRAGMPAAINAFYRDLTEPDTFYVKVDDDVVWMQPNFFASFVKEAVALGDSYTWFSPLVINNAICNWLVKHRTTLNYPGEMFCMAACPVSWLDPTVAEFVHDLFLKLHTAKRLDLYKVPNQSIMASRFSINCIGFWGRDRIAMGDGFAPDTMCDEEWVSALWPVMTGKPGMIIGDVLAAHFSFYPQEQKLLQTDILERYYQLHGMAIDPALLQLARGQGARPVPFAPASA